MTYNKETLIFSYQKDIPCHECHEDTNHELSILSCFEDGNDFTDDNIKSFMDYEFQMSKSWDENDPLMKFYEKIEDGFDKFMGKLSFFNFNFFFTAILLPFLFPLYVVKVLIGGLIYLVIVLLDFALWFFIRFIELSIETILYFLNPINWFRALKKVFRFFLVTLEPSLVTPGKVMYLKKTECLICNFQFQEEILQKDIASYQLEHSDSIAKKQAKEFKAQQKKIEAKIKKDFAWLNKFNKKK